MRQLRTSDIRSIVILVISVLTTLRYLFKPGLYYAHDSLYHFVRLYQYYYELLQFQIPVRMATQLADGRGYPLFNFVYSTPYLIGSLFVALGISYGESLKAVIVLCSLTTIILWYIWLRKHFTVTAALLGSLVFWFLPYRFLTIFVTFQLGTIAAGVFLPLLLMGLDDLLDKDRHNDSIHTSGLVIAIIGLSGLILSHLVTLILYLPLIVFYILWKFQYDFQTLAFTREVRRKLLTVLLVSIFTLGITAYYWLPATFELSWVKAGHEAIVQYQYHFPLLQQLIKSSWGYGYSESGSADGMSFQIGYAQWLVFILSLGLVILTITRPKNKNGNLTHTGLLFVGVSSFACSVFLLLPISSWLWHILPTLQSVQHPWRFLTAIGASASILVSVLTERRWGKPLAIFLVILAIINTRNYQRPLSLEYASDAELTVKKEMQETGDVSSEFLPIWASSLPQNDQAFISTWTGNIIEVDQTINYTIVSSTQSAELELNRNYYPSWNIYVNGLKTTGYCSKSGRIAITLPAGEYSVLLRLGQTKYARIGNAISSATILILLFYVTGVGKAFRFNK